MELQGKRIIVTGSARGMGAATVRAYVGAGADVVAMDLNDTDGEAVVAGANEQGPGTARYLHVDVADKRHLWKPFSDDVGVYDTRRNLYKNLPGNKLVFEEVNHDLGLAFRYGWTSGNRFGFVRESRLINTGTDEVRVELLDGLRNLLPYGVDRSAQAELSTLVDAYKQAETVPGACAALYTLSSILTDRAEPSEALPDLRFQPRVARLVIAAADELVRQVRLSRSVASLVVRISVAVAVSPLLHVAGRGVAQLERHG